MDAGETVVYAAFDDDGPLAAGMHQPMGSVTEIVGVATLPSARRRGLGMAVTRALISDALAEGVELVFLSAAGLEVTRMYEELGFRQVATAMLAVPRAVGSGDAPSISGNRGNDREASGWWLPHALAERARAWARDPGTPVAPRLAATVVILRDTPKGPEVYLFRRAGTMAFAAAMHAFPGGAAESADANIRETAIREVFEETGLRVTQLHPWSRWVTPVFEPRRYDTYFFVAPLPEGQFPKFTEDGEADRAVWLSPTDALEMNHAGNLAMLPPTIETLREISQYSTVTEILEASAGRKSDTLVMPTAVIADEGVCVILPEIGEY